MSQTKPMALVIALAILISLSSSCLAKDFGKQGTGFVIKEEGFVAMMQRKLKEVNLVEHQAKMEELAKKRIEEPMAIAGITRASETKSHSFDPSYVLAEDVFLPCGKLLYARGTTVNALDHMSWSGKLIFIDSRDREQVAWADKNYFNSGAGAKEEGKAEAEGDENKIILVAGRPVDMERETGRAVYFDQFGELTKKFNITHVPAVVEQEGKYLRVTEIDIKGK